jgi:hypothetical protein
MSFTNVEKQPSGFPWGYPRNRKETLISHANPMGLIRLTITQASN